MCGLVGASWGKLGRFAQHKRFGQEEVRVIRREARYLTARLKEPNIPAVRLQP